MATPPTTLITNTGKASTRHAERRQTERVGREASICLCALEGRWSQLNERKKSSFHLFCSIALHIVNITMDFFNAFPIIFCPMQLIQ
jgi:hypothetical protein